jgi:hypothetical protein
MANETLARSEYQQQGGLRCAAIETCGCSSWTCVSDVSDGAIAGEEVNVAVLPSFRPCEPFD